MSNCRSDHSAFSYLNLLFGPIFFFIILSFPPNTSFADSTAESEEPALEILFMANLNGNIANCLCGANPLGGLDRIAFQVDKMRKDNPALLFIDGGDFFNSYPFRELNATVFKIYEKINPDIIVWGDQEFVEGMSWLQTYVPFLQPRLISSNAYLKSNDFREYALLNIGTNNAIAILGYLHQSAFEFISRPEELVFDENKFAEAYNTCLTQTERIILIYHGTLEHLPRLLAEYPQIDLVLNGHNQLLQAELHRSPVLITGGQDGEHLVHIKWIEHGHFDVRFLPINLQLPMDPDITEMINQFEKHIKQKENDHSR